RDFCQISSPWGQVVQRSRSLGTQFFTLDFPKAEKLAPARWFFDNAELESGLRLRRGTLKVSLPRYLSFFYGPRNSRWARPRGPRQSPPGRSFARPAGLYLDPMPKAYFIQWARNTARRDAVLAQFQKEFDRDLSNLENDTQETLSALRE